MVLLGGMVLRGVGPAATEPFHVRIRKISRGRLPKSRHRPRFPISTPLIIHTQSKTALTIVNFFFIVGPLNIIDFISAVKVIEIPRIDMVSSKASLRHLHSPLIIQCGFPPLFPYNFEISRLFKTDG